LSCDKRAAAYGALEEALVGKLAEHLFEQAPGDTVVDSRLPRGWQACTSRESAVQHCGTKGLIQIATAYAASANRRQEDTSWKAHAVFSKWSILDIENGSGK
jgi:hypothetical protein